MPKLPHIDVLTADAKLLQNFLDKGSISSVNLVDLYLAQIQKHDGYLHAMLSMPPQDALRTTAAKLDDERLKGQLRGPLHGVPVIVKDNINTHPSMGMGSTAGSLALAHARPKKNARIIDKLIKAGLIIIGKANLSELSNFRGYLLPSGWSAIGGQVQSAYVRGGVQINDSKDGHSSPSGSSSGSAVAVSAGYAPFSVGTETDGSLTVPANRAALYTIKPTIGLVPQDGLIPVCHTMDAAGPMAKTPYDLAILLDAMREGGKNGKEDILYTSVLKDSWSELSIGALDYTEWIFPPDFMKPEESATAQMNHEFGAAYDKIKSQAKRFVGNVSLTSPKEYELNGRDSQLTIMLADFRVDFKQYLENLENSPLTDLQGLIDFNIKHSDEELPPGHSSQQILVDAVDLNLSSDKYDLHLQHLRDKAKTGGADQAFRRYGVDIIIGPADSFLSKIAAGAGYPIATMPLGYLDYNGRAFGMVAVAAAHQEATLFKVMSAWDKTFSPVKPPPMLVDTSVGS